VGKNSLVVLYSFVFRVAPLAPDLIQKREQARHSKDWAAADQARAELAEKGVALGCFWFSSAQLKILLFCLARGW